MDQPRMLRPMDFGEIFNEAFHLYKENFILFAGIGAVVYIPYGLLSGFVSASPVLTVVVLIGFLVPFAAVQGAIVKGLADRYLGRQLTIGNAWSYVLRRLGPYLGTLLLLTLMVTGAFIVCGLPLLAGIGVRFASPSTATTVVAVVLGCVSALLMAVVVIFLVFWLFFIWQVMIVEDRYYLDAIRRSRELAAGQWLQIFLLLLLWGVLTSIVSMVLAFILILAMGVQAVLTPGGGLPDPEKMGLGVMLLYHLANALMSAALTPIGTLLGILLYFDVRVRKEGFDIELLAQAMGS